MNQTIDCIVEASKLPHSIVIVGVGEVDLSYMACIVIVLFCEMLLWSINKVMQFLR